MGRIFSGVQPTGNLHLGTYLGAIRTWVSLQQGHDCIFCIVDMHAITVWQNPAELRAQTREVTAAFLAAGIDARKHIVFNQSHVPAHAQLARILKSVARLGWLNRMTQFKEKSGKDRENASVGLYVYPNLMAADILAYKATHVPVGEDQRQHLELARDIAQKFNNDFAAPGFFPLPEPLIFGAAARVMSLRDGTKKMSKSDASDYSRINMTDDADTIAQKIRKARTDPALLPGEDALTPGGGIDPAALVQRPEAFNLLAIYAALADREPADALREFAGREFSHFKNVLTDLAVATLGKIGAEMKRLMGDPTEIDGVLAEGARRAREISAPILAETEEIVGFLRA
jgi:tryptophanyl-tRNA synthetase